MNKLKFTLLTFFVSALTLGFTACSDDDDNGGENGITKKLVPSKITIYDEDNELYAENVLTYNSSNQLIKSEDEENNYFELAYDAQGRLEKVTSKYVDEKESNDTYTETYTYTKEEDGKTTVEFFTGDTKEDGTYTLDKNGVLEKFVGQSTHHFMNGSYEFDKNGNLTKMMNDDEVKLSATYTTYFSPFYNMNLPSYFMLYEDYWAIQATGLHMPKTFEEYDYEVLESKDNYPTKVKEISRDGGEEHTYTIIIEYKEIK